MEKRQEKANHKRRDVIIKIHNLNNYFLTNHKKEHTICKQIPQVLALPYLPQFK
jgi:hypothetical protein